MMLDCQMYQKIYNRKSVNGWLSTLALIRNFRLSLRSQFVNFVLSWNGLSDSFFCYHWMCSNSAKRTRITVRNRRQDTQLDQNRTLNWVLRMYEPTHYVCFGAHSALMFLASHCCTTCREIRKLEKSQTVLLSGKLPTPRMEHGVPKSPRKFTWVYWLRTYSKLIRSCSSWMVLHLMDFFLVIRKKHVKTLKT